MIISYYGNINDAEYKIIPGSGGLFHPPEPWAVRGSPPLPICWQTYQDQNLQKYRVNMLKDILVANSLWIRIRQDPILFVKKS